MMLLNVFILFSVVAVTFGGNVGQEGNSNGSGDNNGGSGNHDRDHCDYNICVPNDVCSLSAANTCTGINLTAICIELSECLECAQAKASDASSAIDTCVTIILADYGLSISNIESALVSTPISAISTKCNLPQIDMCALVELINFVCGEYKSILIHIKYLDNKFNVNNLYFFLFSSSFTNYLRCGCSHNTRPYL